MYSLKGGYPVTEMPQRVRRTNGLTYTAEAVLENLDDPTHPYTEVADRPSYDADTQTVDWDGTDWVVSDLPDPVEIESSAATVVESSAVTTETENS
jgi:hypothetical protein